MQHFDAAIALVRPYHSSPDICTHKIKHFPSRQQSSEAADTSGQPVTVLINLIILGQSEAGLGSPVLSLATLELNLV